MQTLKSLISRYMYKVTGILVAFILILMCYVQIRNAQRQVYEDSERTLLQIESVLEENKRELEETQEEYRQTCLHNAEIVARIIEGDPAVVDSSEELREIAASLEVDEIHIFDSTGRIFAGTHPEYFGYTFDSGEQIGFFKPMLEDKTLRLVQDITPNTAEGKLVQYSAIWSENGEYIVQVGMMPDNVMKVTEKNELSYIFSLFRVNPEVSYYAIDGESGKIIGSSDLATTGKQASDIGLDMERLKEDGSSFYAKVNGKQFFCVFRKVDDTYIGRLVETDSMYQNIPSTTLWFFLSLVIVSVLLVRAVVRYMNRYVVTEIDDVNQKLKSITDGNLDEHVDVRSSDEFAKLSSYINSMVKSLLDNNKKMSYALSKSNIRIGTYEYGSRAKRVGYTECIPQILAVTDEQMERLAENPAVFAAFLDEIREHPVSGESGVYRKEGKYIRLEEISEDGIVFGVAVDVTAENVRRLKLEKERDIDALTGLYNRRSLDLKLEKLFRRPERLGHSALLMIDADGLKGINDMYGHDKGDVYLKKLAETISGVGTKKRIAARQGGDEFVLFLYGYDSEEALMEAIRETEALQSSCRVTIASDVCIPLHFSIGYCLVNDETNYQSLLARADKKMYQNKRQKKSSRT